MDEMKLYQLREYGFDKLADAYEILTAWELGDLNFVIDVVLGREELQGSIDEKKLIKGLIEQLQSLLNE